MKSLEKYEVRYLKNMYASICKMLGLLSCIRSYYSFT